MNSMGGTSRTGTHMSAVDCKYLSFTGVGYTDLDYVNLGATRSGAKGAGADIEAGQTDRNGQRRADARIHLPPIPGPARMPLMGEGETMQGLMSALEQRRLDASLTRGQGLPGSVWQTLAQDFVILPHLLDNPEHPRDDLLPLYAKLFLAALGIPIRSASATNKIQGVLMLYLPYTTADGDLVEQAASAIKYLEPSMDSALSIFLSRASELLAALSYRRTRAMSLLHAARLLAPVDVLALDGNGLVTSYSGPLGPRRPLSFLSVTRPYPFRALCVRSCRRLSNKRETNKREGTRRWAWPASCAAARQRHSRRIRPQVCQETWRTEWQTSASLGCKGLCHDLSGRVRLHLCHCRGR